MDLTVIALDPGPVRTALVLLDGTDLRRFGIFPNDQVLQLLRSAPGNDDVVIEMVASYGMAVGAEVFETVYWIGRFAEAAENRGLTVHRRPRLDVKLHHCHDSRAKDSTIRQVLLDRYGGHQAAVGRKKTPGPLYGVKADMLQALALGLMFVDEQAAPATPTALLRV